MRAFLIGLGIVLVVLGVGVLALGLGAVSRLLFEPSLDTGESTWTLVYSLVSALGLAMLAFGAGLIRVGRRS